MANGKPAAVGGQAFSALFYGKTLAFQLFRFSAVFSGIKSDVGGLLRSFGNPEGIESFSPGLADAERPTLGDFTQVAQP